jgi:hypothetical protein
MRYDKAFVTRDENNTVDCHILIDTRKDKLIFSPTLNRHYFLNALGFPTKVFKDDGNVNYPIILDDFTTQQGTKLEEIKLTDIPKDIIKRYKTWRKYQ